MKERCKETDKGLLIRVKILTLFVQNGKVKGRRADVRWGGETLDRKTNVFSSFKKGKKGRLSWEMDRREQRKGEQEERKGRRQRVDKAHILISTPLQKKKKVDDLNIICFKL